MNRLASYAVEIFLSASEATANLLRHSLTENLFSVSMESCETPITVAPRALNWSVASAKSCASTVQPLVKAAGKKNSTTGPLFSASAKENVNGFPASVAEVVKAGAWAPGFSAAYRGEASRQPPSPKIINRRMVVLSWLNAPLARRAALRGRSRFDWGLRLRGA